MDPHGDHEPKKTLNVQRSTFNAQSEIANGHSAMGQVHGEEGMSHALRIGSAVGHPDWAETENEFDGFLTNHP